MFVELEELHVSDNDRLEWRETARWVKYEEDVLEETDRWGKPHVPSLSFRSLLELHTCIDLGTVRLDMVETGLAAICTSIVRDLVESGQLAEENSGAVLQALLLRHVHQCDPHSVPEEPTAHDAQQTISMRKRNSLLPHGRLSETDIEKQDSSRSHSSAARLNSPGGKMVSRMGKLRATSDNDFSRTFDFAELSYNWPGKPRSGSTPSQLGDDGIPRKDSTLQVGAEGQEAGSTSEFIDDSPAKDSECKRFLVRGSLPALKETPHMCVEGQTSFKQTSVTDLSMSVENRSPVTSVTSSGPRSFALRSKPETDDILPLTSASETDDTMVTLHTTDAHLTSDMERLKTTVIADGALHRSTGSGENAAASLNKEERHFLEHLPENVESATVLVGSLDFLDSPIVAFVRLAEGQQLKHVTEVPVPVRFLFIMIGPPRMCQHTNHSAYHEVGRSIATLMADEGFQAAAYRASSRDDLLHAINAFLDNSVVLPPGKWDLDKDKKLLLSAFKSNTLARHVGDDTDGTTSQLGVFDDPLGRTGKFCGGLVNDLRRLRKRYVSDIRDAGRAQVIFTSLFMYFAALAPVITFGGLLGKKTEDTIALSEMLIASSIGGMIFSVLTGQPLMLIGPTGPLLVFEEVIYEFCLQYAIPFLPFRFWTGIWIVVALLLVVANEASYLVNRFTRFTEEVFAALIGFIFIYESLKSIYVSFKNNPLSADFCALDACHSRSNWSALSNTSECYYNSMSTGQVALAPTNEPNSALVYLILVFGTFALAFGLRKLRTSHYLSKRLRRTVSDFGILITITAAVLIAHFLFGPVSTEKIAATSFATTSGRAWLVNPLGGNITVGYIFGAIIPGLLVAFLIFVETQVTALIVGSPDHKLVKGQSFHWNLLIVAVLVVVSSVFGLPWLCGTPVPSLSHTTSLLLYRKDRAPGERPTVSGAVEQRVSNFVIHLLLLITLTTPMAQLMQQVPVAVLFGVFLYLGCVSLLGLQLCHRIVLLLIPPKHHPEWVPYVREVRTRSMHLYTAFQLGCLVLLAVVKLTPAALVFPIIILLMVPLRSYIVTRFFSARELHALDPHGADASKSVEDFETAK